MNTFFKSNLLRFLSLSLALLLAGEQLLWADSQETIDTILPKRSSSRHDSELLQALNIQGSGARLSTSYSDGSFAKTHQTQDADLDRLRKFIPLLVRNDVADDRQLLKKKVDAYLIAGNDNVETFKKVVYLYARGLKNGHDAKIILSGGTGRLTASLVKAAKFLGEEVPNGIPEAEIMRSIMVRMAESTKLTPYLRDRRSVVARFKDEVNSPFILEKESSYTLENFEKVRSILSRDDFFKPDSKFRIMFIQTPLQQLRAVGMFNHVFRSEIASGQVEGISYTINVRDQDLAKMDRVELKKIIVGELFRIIANIQRGFMKFENGVEEIPDRYWIMAENIFLSLEAEERMKVFEQMTAIMNSSNFQMTYAELLKGLGSEAASFVRVVLSAGVDDKKMDSNIRTVKQGDIIVIRYRVTEMMNYIVEETVTVLEPPNEQNKGILIYLGDDGVNRVHMTDVTWVLPMGNNEHIASIESDQFKVGDRVVTLSGMQFLNGVVTGFYSNPKEGRGMIVEYDPAAGDSQPQIMRVAFNDPPRHFLSGLTRLVADEDGLDNQASAITRAIQKMDRAIQSRDYLSLSGTTPPTVKDIHFLSAVKSWTPQSDFGIWPLIQMAHREDFDYWDRHELAYDLARAKDHLRFMQALDGVQLHSVDQMSEGARQLAAESFSRGMSQEDERIMRYVFGLEVPGSAPQGQSDEELGERAAVKSEERTHGARMNRSEDWDSIIHGISDQEIFEFEYDVSQLEELPEGVRDIELVGPTLILMRMNAALAFERAIHSPLEVDEFDGGMSFDEKDIRINEFLNRLEQLRNGKLWIFGEHIVSFVWNPVTFTYGEEIAATRADALHNRLLYETPFKQLEEMFATYLDESDWIFAETIVRLVRLLEIDFGNESEYSAFKRGYVFVLGSEDSEVRDMAWLDNVFANTIYKAVMKKLRDILVPYKGPRYRYLEDLQGAIERFETLFDKTISPDMKEDAHNTTDGTDGARLAPSDERFGENEVRVQSSAAQRQLYVWSEDGISTMKVESVAVPFRRAEVGKRPVGVLGSMRAGRREFFAAVTSV